MKKMIFKPIKGFNFDGNEPKDGDVVSVYQSPSFDDSYRVMGYELALSGKYQSFEKRNFVEPQTSFKEIAELAEKHLETERSPHRKTVTDPSKEKVSSLSERF